MGVTGNESSYMGSAHGGYGYGVSLSNMGQSTGVMSSISDTNGPPSLGNGGIGGSSVRIIGGQRFQKFTSFTDNDRRLLSTLAQSAGVIIRNSLLFDEVRGLNRKNQALVSIIRALQQKHNVIHMLNDATISILQV